MFFFGCVCAGSARNAKIWETNISGGQGAPSMKIWPPGPDRVADASVKFTSKLDGRKGRISSSPVRFSKQIGAPQFHWWSSSCTLKLKLVGTRRYLHSFQGKGLDFDAAAACCGLGNSAWTLRKSPRFWCGKPNKPNKKCGNPNFHIWYCF